MYYLSDANFSIFGRKKRNEEPLPTNRQLVRQSINRGFDNAGKAFVGLAVTARATPQALMRFQLKDHSRNPIMNRFMGQSSLLGNIREQTLTNLQNQGVNTDQLRKAAGGKKLKTAVSQMYKANKGRNLFALNENLPLQGKVAGAIGLGSAGLALGSGLWKRHKQKQQNSG